MQFIDRVEITVCAGAGGDGLVAFRKERYVPRGGPAGGDGGRGGNIVLVADQNINTLVDLRYKRRYKAPNGSSGGPNDRVGKDGADLFIKVPVGTLVYDADTDRLLADLVEHKASSIVASGGAGGRGNARFVSSVLQAPRFAEKGMPTDPIHLVLELKLLADVGLVGFPNVGKSTLISRISAAKPKIADYPFTTLVPNLGVVRLDDFSSYVVADMPGLIEGAHAGAGLGHQFLRHIERTRLIAHLLDISGFSERDPLEDFDAINAELGAFSDKLAQLSQIVVLNKVDIDGAQEIAQKVRKELESRGLQVHTISAVSGEGVKELVFAMGRRLSELPKPEALIPDRAVRFTVDSEDDGSWDVLKTGEHEFTVEGRPVEIMVRRTDLSNEYALRRLHNKLEKMGVIKKLRSEGVLEGDSVVIGDFEFEFTDEAY